MPDPAPLTMRELRGATPRQLEELGAARGIEFPARATSEQMRQALAGRGGVLTSEDVARRGVLADTVPTGVTGNAEAIEKALNKLEKDDLAKVADEFDLDVVRTDGEDGKPRKEDYVEAILHGNQIVGDGRQVGSEGAAASTADAGAEVPENVSQTAADVEREAAENPKTGEPAGEPQTAPDPETVPGNTDAAANAGDDGLEADDVTRAELRSLAQDNNVEFASRDTKPQLVEKLRAANVRRS
jgi:hypothetical protein